MIKCWKNYKENYFREGSYVTGKVLIMQKSIPKSSVRILQLNLIPVIKRLDYPVLKVSDCTL